MPTRAEHKMYLALDDASHENTLSNHPGRHCEQDAGNKAAQGLRKLKAANTFSAEVQTICGSEKLRLWRRMHFLRASKFSKATA